MDGSACSAPSVTWLRDLEAFRSMASAWNALVERTPDATVFQRHEWICAAYATLAKRSPCVGLIWRGTQLVAALPLDIGWERFSGIPLRSARIAGYPRTDRHVFLAENPSLVAALLDAAMHLPVDMVLVAETLVSKNVSEIVRGWLAEREVAALSRRASVARRVTLAATSSDELYGRYSPKHRTNVRRSRRRLEEMGRLDIEILQPSPEETPTLIERLKTIEDVAWQGNQGTGLFCSEESIAFYKGAFSKLAASSDFWGALMGIKGEDAMYILGMTHGGSFYWYSTAYLPKQIKGSAFHVLAHDLMLALREAGVGCFDSSRNTPDRENALDRLDPEMLEHRHFALFRPTPLGLVQRIALTRAAPLYRRARAVLRRQRGASSGSAWQAEPSAPSERGITRAA